MALSPSPLILTSPDLSPSPIPSAPSKSSSHSRTRRRPQRYPTRPHLTPPPVPARIRRREKAENCLNSPNSALTNDLYMDTRRNMLTLAEDNIRLKMEIQAVKEDFFHLLHSLRDFESKDSQPRSSHRQPSVARDRVRSMYRMRKERLLCKRQKENISQNNEEAPPPPIPERSRKSKTETIVNDPLSEVAGDYVTLKSPNDTSVWVDSPDAVQKHKKILDGSPLRYASSDAISEIYTSKSLSNVSHISRLSQSSLREQPSNMSSDILLHSTFDYPLHSTLISDPVSPRDTDSSQSIPQFSPSSYQTPPRHQSIQQKLCKEHGIHPRIGSGPCIFQTDGSTTIFSSGSDITDLDNDRSPPQPLHTDTDCDSSYLSECVEDRISEAEEYTATYDRRRCRMRMLRRQTACPHLMSPRFPVGLSETDLVQDATEKNFSIEAKRSSLPDLSGVSVLPSKPDDSDTILAKNRDSSQENSTSSTLVLGDLDVALRMSSSDSSGARPVSSATTTTEESPESASGLQVPVNSPNITDSGGSSSRPTTDSYDYVDVPKAIASKYNLPPPRPRTPRMRPPPVGKLPTPHDVRSHSSRSSSRSHASRARSHSSGRSRGAKSLDQAILHSYRPESRCSTQSSSTLFSQHFQVVDDGGHSTTHVQHKSVNRGLQRDRKKVLAKKLKKFNNNFYRVNSTGNLNIQTLGHF